MKKNKIIALSTVGALAVFAIGAFAFFSDDITQDANGTIGTVDISKEGDLELTNSENINPGDEDPSNPNPDSQTTSHELKFGIQNDGTKSVVTRNIIDIIVDSKYDFDETGALLRDDDDNYIPVVRNLDPTVFALYEAVDGEATQVDLVTLTDLNVAKFTYVNDEGKTVLRYIIEGASLNGAAGLLEDADFTEITAGDRNSADVNEAATVVDYDYYFGMSHSATDKYMGATVTINVEVQAMQYRNTSVGDYTDNDGDWSTVFQGTIKTGTN